MVARDVVQQPDRTRRIEAANHHTGLAQLLPVSAWCSNRAEPIIDQPDRDALASAGGEGVGELLAGLIRSNDVVLEVNPLLRLGDETEHCRIDLGTVLQ